MGQIVETSAPEIRWRFRLGVVPFLWCLMTGRSSVVCCDNIPWYFDILIFDMLFCFDIGPHLFFRPFPHAVQWCSMIFQLSAFGLDSCNDQGHQGLGLKRNPYHHNQSSLVGGLEHFLFFHILGIIIPTDCHIFRVVGIPPTSSSISSSYIVIIKL